ncbi:uncharacterized protein BDR25DRAFT_324503 [Lindgomyces ingoldianus]|uniref:Uncharacterized protein n=1 Tax=Lindgomyces ingoldianus TaxID=673940 RepID=A0ACB6QY57_9PLEO|nr:uncharacterized protein BDR25DRAFT_324503 [Lindgomyces ingoldianus]KAF2471979.1 hypothetical protein BDR25DRAFT_324503 [Lindgomyces ingoldianus]
MAKMRGPRYMSRIHVIACLTLWSRAARNPGTFRYISCISNSTALVRQPGVASLRGAWAFGTPTSTFVYTAIFAAGLAIDAKAKRDRSEQWDLAFALLREEMAKPSHPTPRFETLDPTVDAMISTEQEVVEDMSIGVPGYIRPEEVWPEGVDWPFIYRIAGTELIDDPVLLQRQSQIDFQGIAEDLWKLLSFDSRMPGTQAIDWPVSTGPDLVRHHLPPQSLWSYDHVREKALRRRHTWKKVAIQELAVGILIHRLLAATQAHQLPHHVLQTLPQSILEVAKLDEIEHHSIEREMLQHMRGLHNMPGELSAEKILEAKSFLKYSATPEFHQDADGDFYYICQQMNTAIKQLLFETDPHGWQIPKTIAKLCHNFLVSSAAPDVQTFNILLAGLQRWKMPDMVDIVIQAFYDCKIRPNEITVSMILDHYIQSNSPTEFSKFVAKMRGFGGALMLADPGITINEAGGGRLVKIDDRKIYQKVFPTPLVFNTLMLGALRFGGLERSLEIYYEMKQDGWGLDVMGLNHFLTDCVLRCDWDNGLYIWEEINSIKTTANMSHLAVAYSTMLSLCSVTRNSAAFNQVLTEIARRGFDRKRILESAMAMAHKAQEEQDIAAPPQTADNVLIAISAYMDDVGPSQSQSQTSRDMCDSTLKEVASPIEEPEEAWASWLEHELGGNVTHGSNQLSDPSRLEGTSHPKNAKRKQM